MLKQSYAVLVTLLSVWSGANDVSFKSHSTIFDIITSPHACLWVYLKNDMSKLHRIFCTCYLWQWLGLLLKSNMLFTSSFVDDVVFRILGQIQMSCIKLFAVTRQTALLSCTAWSKNCCR